MISKTCIGCNPRTDLDPVVYSTAQNKQGMGSSETAYQCAEK
jgi:hypothetical protein